MQKSLRIVAVTGLIILGACSEREVILPGEREDLRQALSAGPLDATESSSVVSSAPVSLGTPVRNAAWAQSPVSPGGRTTHAALGASLTQIWTAPIGQGDKKRTRITANPVAAEGRIFTLDSAATVTATSSAGETLWSADMTPARDKSGDTSGGGLALGGGHLYVTSAFGRVTALDPATGQQIWSQDLQSPGTGAPSYLDGLLYLVAGDTTAWAIEADNGRVRWQIDGLADVNNIAGGAAPAVTDQRVVFSFGTADIQAAFRKGGLRLWSATLAGARKGRALATVDDITGDPVIVGNTVYAGNYSGRTAAIDLGNGERRWTSNQGAAGPVWVAGNSVYLVSDLNQLVRLTADTGIQIWSTDLPGYIKRRRPQARREYSYTNLGPILAGGRLIVASSDGFIRHFNPQDGSLVGTTEIASGATTAPIVMNGTLYVVSAKGQLHAFR